ncbi:MAG: AAA family ATPase, partial [Actinomycetota bacterium]
GKTLLAKALAGEAGAAFFSISGSDFVEMYVGVGASRVRDLFREAREHAPAIVFIDELDSIGRSRGVIGAVAAQGEQEHALNQILAEMDGFSALDGVILVAATNRPDILDPALLRPGRFDRTVALERPDEAARLAILDLHASRRPMDADVDLAGVAHRAIGLTGADMASVVNEAALLAARDGAALVARSHLDRALQRILEAPERQRRLSLKEKGIARRFTGGERVTFDDVAGADDAVAELSEVREFLVEPERFEALGARMPRGILLAGPPGCGKTLLARAVAGAANAAFFSVSGSEFVEVFVGEGASRVRELFAEARAMAPAIVFIDEVDSIGARRSAGSMSQGEREQTLNQILVELDGFDPSAAVVVMAATNRPDMLDPALVRPGRFDRTVSVGLPDRAGRLAILGLHAAGKPLAPGVDLDLVARLTPGFSGADLANVVNEAALLAARRGMDRISLPLLEEGVDRAVLGVNGRATRMSDTERRAVAYHEAGHALVAMALPNTSPPHKLTIVPRGATLGHCARIGDEDQVLFSRSSLLDDLAVGLGGRAAEDLVLGDPLSGVADDLRRVGAVARRMVCELGMSDAVGLVPSGGGPVSDEASRAIEVEVRRLVDESYSRARRVLLAWRPALDTVALALLEHETLAAADLQRLAGPPPVVGPVQQASHMRVLPPSLP